MGIVSLCQCTCATISTTWSHVSSWLGWYYYRLLDIMILWLDYHVWIVSALGKLRSLPGFLGCSSVERAQIGQATTGSSDESQQSQIEGSQIALCGKRNTLKVGELNEMCQYEVIHFHCGHAGRRLIKHCHFARNDPNHQCFGAWSIKREWISANQSCQTCVQREMMRRAQQAQLRI
ncbi:hypothetical protein D0862_04576 [Hortaea werneckii]|uniref:Uncharacterized protein n=2 Tax=Hortaea werneckii TaxID=91943 RepID=A0A3M7H0E3_HORWE|nr:hypothetical protein D0862_04576 [Hortaea werneckii]